MRRIAAIAVCLWAAAAFAHDHDPPPPADPAASASAEATADASAESNSAADAHASTGDVTVTESNPRQTPATAQGSIVLAGCGVAGNAGGAEPGGSGFLGIAFMTPACWDQVTIQNEAAMGNVRTACEMNRQTKSGKRQVERLKQAGIAVEPCPDHAEPAPGPGPSVGIVTPPPDLSNYPTRAEVDQKVERAFEQAARK